MAEAGGADHSPVILLWVSAGEQQAPGLRTALALNDYDDAIDQRFCIFLEEGLQNWGHELPIKAIEAEGMQHCGLSILCHPPMGPIYCPQLLEQPGQHVVKQTLISLKKFCPFFRQEASHGLWLCSLLWRR